MKDKVFGTLTFNHGWVKKETLPLWGKEYEIDIRTSSYPNQEPNDNQKKAYQNFSSSMPTVSEESLVKIALFLMSDPDSGFQGSLEWVMNEVSKHVTPEEVLFFQDGSYALECIADWNDDGIAVLFDNGKITVGYSDEILDCRI